MGRGFDGVPQLDEGVAQPLHRIEFVIPGTKQEEEERAATSAPARGPYPWQRALAPPQEMERARDVATEVVSDGMRGLFAIVPRGTFEEPIP
jgi:hypothetical protein